MYQPYWLHLQDLRRPYSSSSKRNSCFRGVTFNVTLAHMYGSECLKVSAAAYTIKHLIKFTRSY